MCLDLLLVLMLVLLLVLFLEVMVLRDCLCLIIGGRFVGLHHVGAHIGGNWSRGGPCSRDGLKLYLCCRQCAPMAWYSRNANMGS